MHQEDLRTEALTALSGFRGEFYACLSARADELFELTDALLCTAGPVTTLVDLALAPEHRRGHGALYGGLNQGRIEISRFRRALAALRLPRAAGGRLVLAVDVSPWLRPDAATSPDRSFCHTYGRSKDQHLMIPGWPYSVIAALETGRTSWTQVLDALRLEAEADVAAVTAAQVRAQVRALLTGLIEAGQWRPGDPDVLLVFDAGYDLPRLAFLLADLPVEVLGRLRSDRVLHRPAPSREAFNLASPAGGRPPRHGGVFRFVDPATWHSPDQAASTRTTRYGTAIATAWDRLHHRLTRRAAWIDHDGELPVIEGTLIRLSVERLPGDAQPRAGVAVVLGRGPAGRPDRPAVAGVPAQIRPGAYVPVLQADPGLDRAEDPQPAGGRPLDLADHRRLHPAAPGPSSGGGPAPFVGETRSARAAESGSGTARVSQHPPGNVMSGPCAQTRQARPGTSARLPQQAPRSPLRTGESQQTTEVPHSQTRSQRLNNKL
ncbi:transposase, partial [Streptosporangium sp. H16]|uniref:transposase n=1 Tax=Streptosporangium sp. H16 TaxID=3444184 RepID=UPI003F79F798